MGKAATKAKAEKAPDRRALAQELVGIHRKHRTDLERADGLKAQLKKIATDDGENFREMFPDLGKVTVNGAKDKRFKGTVPTVDLEKWNALKGPERNKLIKAGLVTMVDEYTGAYYGGVTVDLF